jgi:hypothetical protein
MSGRPDSSITGVRPASPTIDSPAGLTGAAPGGVHISSRSWRRIGSGLALAGMAALTAVVLGELDRLISSVPASDGRSHALNVVLSPVGPTKIESWPLWSGSTLHGQLGSWIVFSALLDLLLVAALALLLMRIVGLVYRRRRLVPTIVLAVYVGAEGLEDFLQIAGGVAVAVGNADVALPIGAVMSGATVVKWLALIVFLVAILRIEPYRRVLARRLSRIGQAVWVHRLATLAILVIVALSCIPAADLLDQLPDVQRQWADRFGWVHAVLAGAALTATAVVTFVLGRRRTRFLVQTRARGLGRRPADRALDAAAPWLIAPAVLVGMAVLVSLLAIVFGGRIGIHLPTLLAVLFVTGIVPILALAGHAWVVAHPEPSLPLEPGRGRSSWIVGDSLAVLVLVAGGIGVVRSYVVPFVLGNGVGVPSAVGWAWVVVPLGSLVAILGPWLLLGRLGGWSWGSPGLDPNTRDARDANAPYVSRPGRIEWWSFAAAAGCLLAAMFWPSQIAWALGGVAVTLMAISAWVTVFGSFTLIVQARELIAPFRWLRLKASPVLTLGFLLPFLVNVIVSSAAPDTTLHAVQVSNPDPSQASSADLMGERLQELQLDEECSIDVGDERVRPVYLIAAEGGGIRAAYWTASALATLEGCAARSGFVSSGISGGSVGLAVASTVDDEPAGSAEAPVGLDPAQAQAAKIVDRAKQVAGPDVVSTVVLGLTVGDAFAAGTGVHVPSYLSDEGGADDGGWRWRDRAALVEALWERAAPGLSTAFSDEIDPLTGMLMLSSTDVVTKCRLLVDQAPLVAAEGVEAAASGARSNSAGGSCDSVGGLPSMLGFRELAATGGSDATTKCLASLDWSTAAMLSARGGGRPVAPPGPRVPPQHAGVRPRRRRRPDGVRAARAAHRRRGEGPPHGGGLVDPAPHPRHAGSLPRRRVRRRVPGGAARSHRGRRPAARRHRGRGARVDAGRGAATRVGALRTEPGAVHVRHRRGGRMPRPDDIGGRRSCVGACGPR